MAQVPTAGLGQTTSVREVQVRSIDCPVSVVTADQSAQGSGDDLEVIEQSGEGSLSFVAAARPQDGGRMNGCQRCVHRNRVARVWAVRRWPPEQFAPLLRHPERPAEQGLRGCCPERHHNLRLDSSELCRQPRPARRYVPGGGLLVDTPLAVGRALEPEVLDRVGDVGSRTVNAGLGERLVEQTACRADEWPSFAVFDVSGLLTYQHDRRTGRAGAENGLGRVLEEFAAPTPSGGICQFGQVDVGGTYGSAVRVTMTNELPPRRLLNQGSGVDDRCFTAPDCG